MARSTLAATSALLLLGTPAVGATDGNGSASLPAASRLAPMLRAGHPTYVTGGWVCPPGYAWRNAGRQDWLCVDPVEARRVASENQNPPAKAARGPDGAYTCPAGLVARGAFNGDDVCVDPGRRAMVRQMNLALFDAH